MKYRFIYWKDKTTALVSMLIFILSYQFINGQSYFGLYNLTMPNQPLYKYQINSNSVCNGICSDEFIGNSVYGTYGLTMSPEGNLYSIAGSNIFIIDTLTGMGQFFYALPPTMGSNLGLVSTGGGIFYTIFSDFAIFRDSLLRIDTNTGILTNLGDVVLVSKW